MVSYFLLRDNQESGPYTLTELKAKSLFDTDLVWIDGESRCWQHPSDVPSLKELPLATKKTFAPQLRKRSITPESQLLQNENNATVSPAGEIDLPVWEFEESETTPSFEALKAKYAQKPPQKKVWKRQINIGANLMGLLTLFIGLGLSAYMIKKAVENMEFGEPEIASANAIAIEPEKPPESKSTHAAFASALPLEAIRRLVPDTTASQEMNGAETMTTLATAKTSQTKTPESLAKEKLAAQKKANELAAQTGVNAINSGEKTDGIARNDSAEALSKISKPTAETVPEDDAKAEKPEAKAAPQLSANKYNVGILGGISNLQLSVSNPSSQEISKAIVEIEYLRPNGKVVGSQTVTVTGIAPGASKTVAVPDHGRGVKVRYNLVKTDG